LRSGLAPREVVIRAAQGLLPLDPEDTLRALFAVLPDPDRIISGAARATLRTIPPDRLVGFVKSGGAEGAELDLLARETDDPFVLEEIVRSRSVRDETLLYLARTATGRPQEALIANQARLLGEPALIRALLDNPEMTTEGRRLIAELTEEFFEKKARREVAAHRRDEERGASEEALAEEALDADTDLDEADDELGEAGDETPAEEEGEPERDEVSALFIGAIYRRLSTMNVSEKIKLAYTGSKEERRVLIGDTNKLVGIAVLKSRALQASEAESFAAMRNLDEEIYRRISWNREWMRKPAMVVTLVRNPRVPIDITLPLLKRLSIRDLRAVVRDRNLATVVRSTARRFLVLKRR
jgi:hypothetical protein